MRPAVGEVSALLSTEGYIIQLPLLGNDKEVPVSSAKYLPKSVECHI